MPQRSSIGNAFICPSKTRELDDSREHPCRWHREGGKDVSVTVVLCSGSGNSLAMGPMNNSLCVVSLLSDAKQQHFTKTTSSWGNLKWRHPISQKFLQRCLWNGSNVRLIDDGPLPSFHWRSSRAFSSDLPRSKPLVRVALSASLSARLFPFTPARPG